MPMDSTFLFPLPYHDSLGQSQDLDLLIYTVTSKTIAMFGHFGVSDV